MSTGTDSPMAEQASGAAVACSGREADSTAAHTANVTGGKDELLRIVVPVTLKLGRHIETENPATNYLSRNLGGFNSVRLLG